MNQAKLLRENTRILECHLGNINKTDSCCCGISEPECFVLVEIGRKPNISVKELAEILRLDKSGVSRTVEELVQKDYVERKPSTEDRRFVVLNLTLKGKERFEKNAFRRLWKSNRFYRKKDGLQRGLQSRCGYEQRLYAKPRHG